MEQPKMMEGQWDRRGTRRITSQACRTFPPDSPSPCLLCTPSPATDPPHFCTSRFVSLPGSLLPSADHTGFSAKPRIRQLLFCEGQCSGKIKEQAVLSDTLLIKLLQADSIINEPSVPCRRARSWRRGFEALRTEAALAEGSGWRGGPLGSHGLGSSPAVRLTRRISLRQQSTSPCLSFPTYQPGVTTLPPW